MKQQLANALEAISLERDQKVYTRSFIAVSELLREYEEENLAQRIFEDVPRTIQFELVAELFDFLTWSTNDNGAQIHRTIEAWILEASDERKISIALNLEIFPFVNAIEMYAALENLVKKHPCFFDRCNHLIESRKHIEARSLST
jgi:hypothetical protein